MFGVRNTAAAGGAAQSSGRTPADVLWFFCRRSWRRAYFSRRGDDTTISLLEDTLKVYGRAYELNSQPTRRGLRLPPEWTRPTTCGKKTPAPSSPVRRDRAKLEHAMPRYRSVPSTFGIEPANSPARFP